MQVIKDFNEYEILDMANGMKVEKWNNIILERPDPQVIWIEKNNIDVWDKVDAKYNRSNTGGGSWEIKNKIPDSWPIKYKNLTFNLKLMVLNIQVYFQNSLITGILL